MPVKKTKSTPAARRAATKPADSMAAFLQRVFLMMFGAVALTGLMSWLTINFGLPLIINQQTGGFNFIFYALLFGGLALSIFAQARVFSMKPQTAGVLLALYAASLGIVLTPLIASALFLNPASLIQAFFIAAAMFGCMALFGYKTARDLSFMGVFLFMGMIGLILVGIASMIWPLGSGFMTIVCLVGVLVFALFTAYDMQFLKRAHAQLGDRYQRDQLAVLGALHLYIAFIAMFQYILMLLNRR
ncbi:MAG: Bax inhibitor-1/YccA family protein [Alphaproteobacteria bacterium]|nr:Bax inhibitor-1/YccA family protein [Alphaproteobacteria bacterium]MCL2757934.1 Bax inhibitor-1/YccA family protein [Alphaproteobacteria bacterium]